MYTEQKLLKAAHDLQKMWAAFQPYNPNLKQKFHAAGKRFFRLFAEGVLKLEPHQYDLRSNLGGDAVSGEITLHTDTYYYQASVSCMSDFPCILHRRCDSRRDFTGYQNKWCKPETLCHDPRPVFNGG